MNKVLDWIYENSFSLIFLIWFLSSMLEFAGIVIDVKHTDIETGVSTKVSVEKEKPKDTPLDGPVPMDNGPKASW